MKIKVIFAILSVCIGSAGFCAPVQFRNLQPEMRVQVMDSLIIDEFAFKDEKLDDCLKRLSDYCVERIGFGFSRVFQNVDRDSLPKVTMNFQSVTVADILKYLSLYTDVEIKLSPEGCVISKRNQMPR